MAVEFTKLMAAILQDGTPPTMADFRAWASVVEAALQAGLVEGTGAELVANNPALDMTDSSTGNAASIVVDDTALRIDSATLTRLLIASQEVARVDAAGLTVTGALSASQLHADALSAGVQGLIAGLSPIKAWCVFDGTSAPPAVAAGANVSSITRVNTGIYDIVFTDALPSTNYAVFAMGLDPGHFSLVSRAVDQCRITGGVTNAYFPTNPPVVSVLVLG